MHRLVSMVYYQCETYCFHPFTRQVCRVFFWHKYFYIICVILLDIYINTCYYIIVKRKETITGGKVMKKYNLANIMTRAWEIKHQDDEYLFGLCLKMAWAEAKEEDMTEDKIEALTERFGRWTKTGWNGKKYDRIYFNAKDLGLELDYYKTGNISDASIDGMSISNSRARQLLSSKAYYDVLTGELHIDSLMDMYFGDQIRALVA